MWHQHISDIFSNKYTCEKCGKRLSKKNFTDYSIKKICDECQGKENKLKKRQESEENRQYIEKNCRELFVISCSAYDSTTSVWFDISKKEPCIVYTHSSGPRDSLLNWSYSYISFDRLKELATAVSEEVFEKFKDIDEGNWQQYIEEIEKLTKRKLILYTGEYQQYGFSSIILQFQRQPFGSKSWWELEWKGVLENHYGSGGTIILSEDFMRTCSAVDLYEYVKSELNTNTEIPEFYDNEELTAFLRDIQC